MKYLFALYVVALTTGCGSDRNCQDKRIIQIRNCQQNYQLQCQACEVNFSDGSHALLCQPIRDAIYKVCSGAV